MITIKDIYDIINLAIDDAFVHEKYQLNFFEYLEHQKTKRKEVISFLESSLCVAIHHQLEELNLYLNGGDRSIYVRESYDWMGKPRVKRIKEYLETILNDAKRYEQSKRPGRKPKSTNK